MQHIAIDKRRRLEAIDFARGAALAAMAIYHFTWDLEFFGYAEPGMTAEGGWRLFARSIASSFLFLVGVSLFLAHSESIRWKPFFKRLAMVAGAAAAISFVTWLAVPNAFIFFGILHEIALASLLGLAFLRLPALFTAIVAVAVIVITDYLRTPFFDHPALWWVGLAPDNPHSNDYVPVFPWFGAVLLGIAAARAGRAAGLFERMREWRLAGWTRPVQFAGRHSLAVYLIHQPVLIACVWTFSQMVPPAEPSREFRFAGACERQCEASGSDVSCRDYCGCVLDGLVAEGRFDEVYDGAPSDETSRRLQALVAECTLAAETFGTGDENR